MSRPCPETFGNEPALGVLWGPLGIDPDPLVHVSLRGDFIFLERLVLTIRGKLDRVCHEPDDEEYVVRCLEEGVGLFGSLVHGKRNRD